MINQVSEENPPVDHAVPDNIFVVRSIAASDRAKSLKELGSGRIDTTLDRVQSDANGMSALLDLFEDPDTELNIRIGISAIMEELEGSVFLKANIETLGALTQHQEARVRGDACHYLSLSHDPSVRNWIEPLLDDPDGDVREVARDSLAILADQ